MRAAHRVSRPASGVDAGECHPAARALRVRTRHETDCRGAGSSGRLCLGTQGSAERARRGECRQTEQARKRAMEPPPAPTPASPCARLAEDPRALSAV